MVLYVYMKITDRFLVVVGFIAAALLLSFLMAYPVKWLWNGCLVGAIDGVHSISLIQAWGLSILSSLFFKSYNTSSK